MFEALLKNRMSVATASYGAIIEQSELKNTFRQKDIMKNWAVMKEFVGIAPEERKERFETVAQLNTLAEDIMCERGRIFDVSNIADKFPRGDMTGIQLRDIQLPFDEFFMHLASEKVWQSTAALVSISRERTFGKQSATIKPISMSFLFVTTQRSKAMSSPSARPSKACRGSSIFSYRATGRLTVLCMPSPKDVTVPCSEIGLPLSPLPDWQRRRFCISPAQMLTRR